MRQRQRTSRTTNGVTTAAAAAATAAAVDESQHIVHPVAIRPKIPLKRKVREKQQRRKKGQTSSSALAVFRKTRKRSDPERRRRSGVVNTKDKVRSWLERENPTRETVDSDNESHFPEEEIPPKRAPNVTVAPERRPSEKPVHKMMRSISENHPPQTATGRHHFSRSISHGHEPDFSRLSRKTESHSHLLSKSNLDLVEDKTTAEPADNTVTHPPVNKRIPNPVIPKSATDGHLKASSGKSKFASFEFLNLIQRKSAPDKTPSGRTRHSGDDDPKVRKKIGIGPVKVVLKWHGAGRLPRVKRTNPGKKDEKRKKRVIVYKNGDPTAAASAASASFAERSSVAEPLELEVKECPAAEINIIANPMESTESAPRRSAEAVFRSRRYSMQERLSQPPPLVRRVSEIHATSGQQQQCNSNSRRNRHSWTVGTVPEFPITSSGDIGIDIDQDDC